MVTPQLKAMFKAQGIQIIPRQEGAEQVACMLTMPGRDRSQCLVGNWGLPPVGPAGEQLIDFTIKAAPANSFLDSHVIQGKRVLPMTVAISKIASAAIRSHPGHHLVRVENAQLFGGVGVDADVAVTLKLTSSRAPTTRRSRCRACSPVGQRPAQPAYGALVVLTRSSGQAAADAASRSARAVAAPRRPPRSTTALFLFHGPPCRASSPPR